MTSGEPGATQTITPRAVPAPAASLHPPRSLAPDLARGALLLFIALANVWGYLWSVDGTEVVGGRPAGGSTLDHVVDGLTAFLVDDRSRPMFAILYGFGLATIATRLAARGADDRRVRRVLARRGVLLVVLGVLHAALLFGGDILAAYGATGLVALAFLHRSRRTLLTWFWVATALMTAAGTAALLLLETGGPATSPTTSYLASIPERLTDVAFTVALATVLLFFVPMVVLGILLARAGWLTRPWEHRRRLGQVTVAAFATNLVANLPFALAVGQVWQPDGVVLVVLEMAHLLSGVVTGLGYVCLFGWVAAVWHDRPAASARRGAGGAVVVDAVTAVGERSLTCYLLQSAVLAPLLSAWGLALGGRIGTAQAALLAVGVWLVTAVVALAMARTGRRGPLEVLLRRVMYRPAGAR